MNRPPERWSRVRACMAVDVGVRADSCTIEVPSLFNLIDLNQVDTIYHEHFSYLSLSTVSSIFERAGLRVIDVEELSAHGGSLRLFGCHLNDTRETNDSVHGVCLA